MRILKPIPMTEAALISSTLSATDHATWSASTTYATGNRVQFDRRVYESRQDSNLAHNPTALSSGTYWADAGPTNRWAMFDTEINTQSIATAPTVGGAVSISVTLAPGRANGLALIELVGRSVQVDVRATASSPIIYTRTVDLTYRTVTSWYQFYTTPIENRTLVSFLDLPAYSTSVVTITVTGNTTVKIGAVLLGNVTFVAATRHGASLGINDFSKKSTNDFGVTTLVRRGFTKKASFPLLLDQANLERVFSLLSDMRGIVTLCIGIDGQSYSPTVIYGFLKDFSLDLATSKVNYCTVQYEGMI